MHIWNARSAWDTSDRREVAAMLRVVTYKQGQTNRARRVDKAYKPPIYITSLLHHGMWPLFGWALQSQILHWILKLKDTVGTSTSKAGAGPSTRAWAVN